MDNPVRYLALLAALVGAALPTTVSGAPGYLPPEPVGGMVFPVARTDHYSVINFGDDWLVPRMRRVNGEWRQIGVHEGTDIFAEPGTPVRAITGGRIENIGWLFYSGWRVGIRGDDGRYWFYAHLANFGRGLGEGDRVEPGSIIGRVGNTGYGDRPGHKDEFIWHLHVGIQESNGTWINPYPMLHRLYQGTGKA